MHGVGRVNKKRLLPNFQKGGTWQDLNFEKGAAEKEGGNFFQGGLQLLQKK